MNSAALQLHPLRAFRAMRVLAKNPDDTAQVFTIIEALSGRAVERAERRFAADDTGRRLLADRPNIVEVLHDRARLRSYGPDTLAAAYLAFVESEKISADGLVSASDEGEAGERKLSPRQQFIHDRVRDTHDLWHALLGYRGDVLGETAILAFTLAQTRNPGIALIVAIGLVKWRSADSWRLIIDAFRRGLVAKWLPAQDWESLLALPVDEVRRRLKVGAPREYTPVRTAELRAQGRLPTAA